MTADEDYQRIARLEYGKAALNNSYAYESPIRELGSTVIFLTSADDELHEFELDLRNMYERDNQLIKAGEPLLNERGIRSVLRHVRPTVNRLSIMSNYEKNRIKEKLLIMLDNLTLDLALHGKEYGIKCAYDGSVIIQAAVDYCESSLGRALEQGERRFLKGSHQEVTLHNDQKKQGLMGNMLGWGRR